MEGNWIIEALRYLGDEVFLHKISPVFFMYEYQAGVLLRNGVYVRDLKKGLNLKWPVVDRMHTVISSTDTFCLMPVPVTTLDNLQVNVEPIVKFKITDPRKYLIDTNDAASNLRDVTRGVIANYLTDCNWEDIKKKPTLTAIKNALKVECAEIGVQIERVYFGRIVTTKVFTVFKE